MAAGGHREIQLTKGYVALVDAEDFEWLSQWQWQANCNDKSPRAMRNHIRCGNTKIVYMHRVILGAPKGALVDHVNGDSLDNRRENLRLCTAAENSRNRRPLSASGFKGVSLNSGSWRATICVDGRRIYLGRYSTAVAAGLAYDAAARLHHGDFARLNFPEAQHG